MTKPERSADAGGERGKLDARVHRELARDALVAIRTRDAVTVCFARTVEPGLFAAGVDAIDDICPDLTFEVESSTRRIRFRLRNRRPASKLDAVMESLPSALAVVDMS